MECGLFAAAVCTLPLGTGCGAIASQMAGFTPVVGKVRIPELRWIAFYSRVTLDASSVAPAQASFLQARVCLPSDDNVIQDRDIEEEAGTHGLAREGDILIIYMENPHPFPRIVQTIVNATQFTAT